MASREEATQRTAALLRGERFQVLAVGAAGALVLGLLYVFDPAHARYFLGCPLHERTGLRCAGCGGQRALHALLHGRVLEALSFNLLAVLVFVPLAAYAYAAWALRVFHGVTLSLPRLTVPRAVLMVCLLLLYAIIRNLPGPV